MTKINFTLLKQNKMTKQQTNNKKLLVLTNTFSRRATWNWSLGTQTCKRKCLQQGKGL